MTTTQDRIAEILAVHFLEKCMRMSTSERTEWWQCLGCGWESEEFDLDDTEVRREIDRVKRAHLAAEIDAAVHPRIDTLEQLDALPFLTIVREVYGPSPSGCDYGAVWERRTSGWQCIAGSVMPPRDEHAPRLGCRVLYTPEVDR